MCYLLVWVPQTIQILNRAQELLGGKLAGVGTSHALGRSQSLLVPGIISFTGENLGSFTICAVGVTAFKSQGFIYIKNNERGKKKERK